MSFRLKRRNAMKNKTRKNTILPSDLDESSGSEMGEEEPYREDSEEDSYIQTWFGDDESRELLKQMRKSIVYVLIRGHSTLPYDPMSKLFREYEMPSDMNLIKITGSANGEKYCGRINYVERKELIKEIIKNNSNVNQDVANKISAKLTENETGEDKLTKNVVSDNKTVLDKVIFPFSVEEFEKKNESESYKAVELLFLDDRDVETNSMISLDLYDDIIQTKISQLKKKNNRPLQIKISDIIHFLYNYFKLKNVVLIDFTCSSFWEGQGTIKEEDKTNGIAYLNENNLHGGIKKRKNKTKKRKNKTKKRKRKNKKKTKGKK